MPRYLDAHNMKGFDENKLKQAKNSPMDEFGVTIMIYSITRRKTNYIAFWMHLIKKQLKNIMRNLASNAIGLQKLSL